jgi:hypothetical protein
MRIKVTASDQLIDLKPSRGAWTRAKVDLGICARSAYWAIVYPALALVVQPQVKAESWKLIASLDLKSMKTVGHIEKFALKLMNREMIIQKQKEEVHCKLQAALKAFSKEGLLATWPAVKELIYTK